MTDLALKRENWIHHKMGCQYLIDKVLWYYRQGCIEEHADNFEGVYDQMLWSIIYLNSTKYPGYTVFFSAKRLREHSF